MLHCSSAPELCRDRNSGLPPLANSSRVRVQSLKCRKILTKKCQNRRATFSFRLPSLFLIEFMAAQFLEAAQGNPGHPCWSVSTWGPQVRHKGGLLQCKLMGNEHPAVLLQAGNSAPQMWVFHNSGRCSAWGLAEKALGAQVFIPTCNTDLAFQYLLFNYLNSQLGQSFLLSFFPWVPF